MVKKIVNKDLRKKIVEMVHEGGDGHIPSAFSILDIINHLYKDVITFKKRKPHWDKRDYFILSKGHGCLALYVVLEKFGILKKKDLSLFCKPNGILGEHPDATKVPGAEASTGSLGHGLSFSVGIAKGLKIRNKKNQVIVLVGDGECQEGTVWEAANIAKNHNLNNLTVIVDFNLSGAQLLPYDKMLNKWKAFGWDAYQIDGHEQKTFKKYINKNKILNQKNPTVFILDTIKGKGAKVTEGHGKWHHKIPNKEEVQMLKKEIDNYE